MAARLGLMTLVHRSLRPRVAAMRRPLRLAAVYEGSAACHSRGFASGAASGFRCGDCGQQFAKWQGQCSNCAAWSTIAPAKASASLYRQSNADSYSKAQPKKPALAQVSWGGGDSNGRLTAHRMKDIETTTAHAERLQLPERELNWVLGGGLVPGSLTLVAGNPGVGKSTLALQVANMLAGGPDDLMQRDVLYVSGEESALQVKMRAQRLGNLSDGLFVANETNLEPVLELVHARSDSSFAAVVIDSIQTMYVEDVPSAAGSVNQVKECTLRLLRLAKQRNLPIVLIGHVTKSGDIAGPKVLEHIVDTVVQLEGDPQSARRFLRCQKNRFGNTSEVGVFDMTDSGLQPLVNPLLAFVPSAANGDATSDQEEFPDGSSITIAMEGTRPIPLEIQALASRINVQQSDSRFGGGGSFSRVRGVGVSFDKLQLLFAVLQKRARVPFDNQSVFVNIAEGYSVQEPAADLALAVALASAVLNRPVRHRSMFLGEIALSGHVRPVKLLEARLSAASKIGLELCVIPRLHCDEARQALRTKFGGQLEILEAATVLDALKIALGDDE